MKPAVAFTIMATLASAMPTNPDAANGSQVAKRAVSSGGLTKRSPHRHEEEWGDDEWSDREEKRKRRGDEREERKERGGREERVKGHDEWEESNEHGHLEGEMKSEWQSEKLRKRSPQPYRREEEGREEREEGEEEREEREEGRPEELEEQGESETRWDSESNGDSFRSDTETQTTQRDQGEWKLKKRSPQPYRHEEGEEEGGEFEVNGEEGEDYKRDEELERREEEEGERREEEGEREEEPRYDGAYRSEDEERSEYKLRKRSPHHHDDDEKEHHDRHDPPDFEYTEDDKKTKYGPKGNVESTETKNIRGETKEHNGPEERKEYEE